MKISLNWLKEYIQTDASPEQISLWLTDCGLEVEALEKTESIKGGLKGVVIGQVITCGKHPDADRLSVTTVDIGSETVPIVCGAPNVAEGQKVVVATVGSTLYPAGSEGFQIKKAKIRGQLSMGMICAEDELGLGNSHDGIMVLNTDVPNGTHAADYFRVEEDYCIEIGLTPNRIDAASHMGVARDLAAVINHLTPGNKTKLIPPDIGNFKPDATSATTQIIIEDPIACPRYTGLCIEGVTIKESPDWLKNRLKTIGLKPINNVVDITNFVLHETGQPLHAFDAAKITGNKVVIKKPAKDTSFLTLDEEEVKLTGNDLMICNEKEPMCMAGILGGMDSGVTKTTKDIFLESAYFEASGIRKSSKHYGINTDSSFRFERGADPEMTTFALKRAGMLIKELAGGRIVSEVMDVYPNPIKPNEVVFRFESAYRLMGKAIEKETIRNILQWLGIRIKNENQEQLTLEVPPFKVDVTREADIVEEILRIYGYNNIELPERLHSSIVASPQPDKEKIQNVASDLLSARGFHEIMNNSLSRASYYNNPLFDDKSIVKILNPLSQDLGVMRQTLFFGGMETIAWNQNRRVSDLKLYEFGNIYFREKEKKKEGALKLSGYREQRVLAVFLTGNVQPESWYAPQKKTSLFELKAEILSLLEKMNVPTRQAAMEEIHAQNFYEAGIRYSINGKVLAEVGEVSRKYLKDFDLKQDVFFGTVNWELVLELHNTQPIRFVGIPRFPEVRRDLALLIGKTITFSQIKKLAFTAEKKLLKEVRLFDIYQDDKIGADKKSYAVSFTLQDETKTLTDKEIDKVMRRITQTLQKELDAAIR